MKGLYRWAGRVPWLWVGLVCGLAVTASVWAAPGNRLVGEQFLDAMGTQWFYWYAGELFQDERVAFSRLLFFPFGKAIYLHTGGNLVDALVALPLRTLLGPIAGYNLFILLLFALNALGAARLAATFRLGHAAQAAAACLFCLNPYLLIELNQGRPTQAFAFALPLALAAMRERRGLLAGLLIGLSGLTYWYYGLMLGAAAALTGLAMLALEPGRSRTAWSLFVGFWATMLVVVPVALPMFGALSEGAVPGLLRFDPAGFWGQALGGVALETEQGDPQGLFVMALNGMAGPITAAAGELSFGAGARLVGWAQLALALPGLWILGRRGGQLAMWAGLGLLIAAGPVFWLGGPENPVYTALFEHLSLFRRWWWPMRASVLVQISLAVWGAVTVDWVARALEGRLARVRGRRGRLTLLVLPLLGWAWSGGAAPLDTWEARVSPLVSECLRHAPPGAVIDLPLAKDQFQLWDQVWHEKPQMGGMLSQKAAFGAGQVDALLAANPPAAMLVALGQGNYTTRLVDDPEQWAALARTGYRYVLLRHEPYERVDSRGKTHSDVERLTRLISKVMGPPAAVDREGVPHPVSLWTLDGTRLECGG